MKLIYVGTSRPEKVAEQYLKMGSRVNFAGMTLQNALIDGFDSIRSMRIILTGKRNNVDAILKDTDISIFASLNENHSIALMKVVNMRCACLVTNVGGNPVIIQNKVNPEQNFRCDLSWVNEIRRC